MAHVGRLIREQMRADAQERLHPEWVEQREAAQEAANRLGRDVGLERAHYPEGWRWFLLPAPRFRQGHELRCEVVSPEKMG